MTVAVRTPRSVATRAERRRLPRIRPSYTVSFQVGGAEGTLTAGAHFFPPVSTWSLMPKLMGQDRPLGWICANDVGAIAARAFAEPDRFVGAELGLASDIQSIAQCRQIWQDVYGRPPRRFPMPVWMFRRFVGSDLIMMWRWLRTAQVQFDPTPTRELLPTALTVREWLVRRRTSAT